MHRGVRRVKDLAGKRALVTGGSRGIGAAVAEVFAEHGVHVAIGYRSRRADADALVGKLTKAGVKAFAHASDIGTREGADELIEKSVGALGGGLDFFVH